MKSMTPEARAALSAKMKVVMNDPEVRRRVSDATKKVRDHGERTPDLRLLLDAWTWTRSWAREQLLRQNIRKRFLEELLSPLFVDRVSETKSAPEGPAR
jgi:hypothetical protein